MKCHVFDDRGITLVRVEERVPVCGETFCDTCGDCLHCYGEHLCFGGGQDGGDTEHYWVQYGEENEG